LALGVGVAACPFTPVVTLVVAVPPKLALAPAEGAVNVTSAPETRLPPASFTVAMSGAENAVLMVAVCGDPLAMVIEAGAPTVFIRAKLAVGTRPVALAVTL
jgi:hypothetical protein